MVCLHIQMIMALATIPLILPLNRLIILSSTSSIRTRPKGMGITLKVMAGDRIDIWGRSYYNQNNPTDGTDPSATIPITEILSGLIGGAGGVVATTSHEDKLQIIILINKSPQVGGCLVQGLVINKR